MAIVREAQAEPIPGYRLLELLGSGGFGEVWKCEAPGGIFKAVKIVYGDLNGLDASSAHVEDEFRAIQHVKAIRHPFLLSIDRVEIVEGELVIVTELADQNLEDLFKKYRQQEKVGIPRGELLNYLREAAEVLDLMNIHYNLQHLDIKPRNLFLVHNHVKVADFGLVNSLAAAGEGTAVHLGAITPLYASPEVFLGQLSRHCDQYSLAIVFQELLTGRLPFDGKNVRQLLFQHTREEPTLSALPERDRPIVARALSKDPTKRFPTCSHLIAALLEETKPKAAASRSAGTKKKVKAQPVTVASHPLPAEAVNNSASEADTWANRKTPQMPPDALPGYRFLECLSNSPLMDQWKVQGPDGQQRLLKLIYGYGLRERRLEETVVRLRSLQHPGLVSAEVVHAEPGRLIMLTDLVETNLRDRAQECHARKFPGIMRGELLDYVRTAAETLDYLYLQHSIQHLGLNPRNLVLLDDGRLQIADFGLTQLLWLPAGQNIAQRNARYTAPELDDKRVTRTSDQFSLALVYAEMLTGVHPLRTSNAGIRGADKPNLIHLPDPDRTVIARALDADPTKRWPSCMDMVLALEGTDSQAQTTEQPDRFATMLTGPRPAVAEPVPTGTSPEDLNQIIKELITCAGGELPRDEQSPPVLGSGGDLLTYKFQAGLPLGSARLKLDAFGQQWYAQLRRDDEQGCVFHISMPANFWRQWIGRQPGLEVQIRLSRVQALSATPIEVAVEIHAFRCSKKRGHQLLTEMGPPILDSLRNHLLVNSEKRLHDRLLWPHPVVIRPLSGDGKAGEPVQCQGKDISLSGIGFYLPEEIETSEIVIELPNTLHPPSIPVPASLVRAKRCTDGWYEVGALFRLPALRKSFPEMQLQ